jgi:hypothetical protein
MPLPQAQLAGKRVCCVFDWKTAHGQRRLFQLMLPNLTPWNTPGTMQQEMHNAYCF